jgi:hypothetical protein
MRRIFGVWVCGWALLVAFVGGQAQTMKPAKPAGAAPKTPTTSTRRCWIWRTLVA